VLTVAEIEPVIHDKMPRTRRAGYTLTANLKIREMENNKVFVVSFIIDVD
jgi:hypothetical protein